MENLKLCEIITSGDYGSMTDLTDNQRKFVTLHTEICRKGAYVVSGMVEFAEKLKEMRDGKSYVEAGFGSFGEYCEKAVGIKTSMAYRYVKVYEDEEKYVDLITEPNLLELWAKKFHNCSYGYCDRIINGKCVIFLVRLKAFPEYPFCMFELETGSCRVVQARDRHNHKVSKYIEDFIYGFVDEMKLRVKYAEH